MPGSLDTRWSRLTGAIIQLQTSVHAYKSSQRRPPEKKSLNSTSPNSQSKDFTSSVSHLSDSISILTISPSRLDALEDQLASFEHQLKQRGLWRTSPHFRPDPSHVIDLSDLEEAIFHLKNAIDVPWFPRPARTPHAAFSSQKWKWDVQWSEWYYEALVSESYVYLSEWVLLANGDDWDLVLQDHKSVEEGLETLGSWEDWDWDEEWGEWYLPLAVEDGSMAVRRMYASEWTKDEKGDWVYVDRRMAYYDEV